MNNKKIDTLWVVVRKNELGFERRHYCSDNRADAREVRAFEQHNADLVLGKNVVRFSVRKFKLETEKN